MRVVPVGPNHDEVFSIDEVARAGHATVEAVRAWLDEQTLSAASGFLTRQDAIRAVRFLRGSGDSGEVRRLPLTLLPKRGRKTASSLAISFAIHAGLLALLITAATLGFFNSVDTEQLVTNPDKVRLVFIMAKGPSGGGGGGGLANPLPPPPAERKAPKPEKKPASPVPPVRKVATPPPPMPTPPRPIDTPPPVPIEVPRVETPSPTATPVPPPPPPQAVQAPVAPVPTGQLDRPGTLAQTNAPASTSNGPGSGGGIGTGNGAGIGEGQGGGIGPGSGGGTGGGPFQPGSGVTPPVLLKEVRPGYTDEARRRSIEGDVQLEIVVRQDGSVGNVRVTRTLGAGLEQKAIEAVRQWKFGPARRQGAAVDVVVEVSVEFKLR